jgi:hypothetical protein
VTVRLDRDVARYIADALRRCAAPSSLTNAPYCSTAPPHHLRVSRLSSERGGKLAVSAGGSGYAMCHSFTPGGLGCGVKLNPSCVPFA